MENKAAQGGLLVRTVAYWKLIVGLGLCLFLLSSIVSGYTLFRVFETRYVVTIFGLVVIMRKILQQRFAYLHNEKAKVWTWELIFEELKIRYPHDEKWLKWAQNLHVTYDDRRALIAERYPDDLGEDHAWRALRRSVFRGNEPRNAMSIPIFKVSLEEVVTLIDSVTTQSYPVHYLYLVVNGRWDERVELIRETKRHIRKLRQQRATGETLIKVIVMKEEKGDKRKAMKEAFIRGIKQGVDIVFNVDSDTLLDIDAVANAMQTFMQFPNVVCLTGDVRINNPTVNLLTLMTAIRYFIAFNIERAAQSYFGQMTCLSGPFFAIRAEYLALIVEDWSNQWFLGQRCTFGDDRHIATLCLLNGWTSIFLPESICWTASPVTRAEWLLQQLRWNKSADRENWILVIQHKLRGLHPYIMFDLFYLTIFPFLVVTTVSMVLFRAGGVTVDDFVVRMQGFANSWPELRQATDQMSHYVYIEYMALVAYIMFPLASFAGLYVVLPYVALIIGLNIVFQGIYGWRLTGNWRYLFSFAYVIYLPDLTWLKVRAKLDATKTGWGTK